MQKLVSIVEKIERANSNYAEVADKQINGELVTMMMTIYRQKQNEKANIKLLDTAHD